MEPSARAAPQLDEHKVGGAEAEHEAEDTAGAGERAGDEERGTEVDDDVDAEVAKPKADY